MLLPFLCLVFSVFPILPKIYQLVLFSCVSTRQQTLAVNPEPQASPPATSQLESRGGWMTLPHTPCTRLKEDAGGQAEMQRAMLVFPNWVISGPQPWSPSQGTVGLRGPRAIHRTPGSESPSTRRQGPDSYLNNPECL